MGLIIGMIGLGLLAAVCYLIYLAVIVGGAILLGGLLTLVGIYMALMQNFGPEITWSVIGITSLGIIGLLFYQSIQQARSEAARREEEQRLEAIARENERQRLIAFEIAEKAALREALAKPWHDRSLSDWKRVWFD